MMNRLSFFVFLLLIFAACWSGCERPTQPPNANRPPLTKLANIPFDGDTVFPLATMNWTGGDEDGYVARYQYRYVTYHLATGSNTLWQPYDSTNWHDTSATSVTIAFNSNQNLNKQIFYVRAIDNEGMVDPNPISRVLYTTKAYPPASKIVKPVTGVSVFVQDVITDWWGGIELQYKAVDQTPKGKVVDYAWSVDGGEFHWTEDTLVTVTPDNFKRPLSGYHYFKVISRNNTNLVDPIGDSIAVKLLYPTFEKDILIIDETDEFNLPFITYNVQDSTIDNFYARVFPGADMWDYKAHSGMPPRDTLAHYKLIVWHADDWPQSVPHKISLPENIAIFTDYLKIGGKFLMSGWGILKSFAYLQNFPYTFPPGTFVYDFLHINQVSVTDLTGDCIGGSGVSSKFSRFRVDTVKTNFFPFFGKLGQINLITVPAGFTEGLYSYENLPNSSYVKYRGRYIGLRYYGTVYDAAVLGFPLYFVQEDDAKVMAKEILQSLKVR